MIRGYPRTWLGVALFVLNAVVILTTLLALQRLHDHAVREAEIRAQNLVLATDLNISNEISKIELSLDTVIAELHHQETVPIRYPEKTISALIQQQKALLQETEAWSITDAEGNIVFHDSKAGPANFTIAEREYFKALQSDTSNGLVITRPITSKLTGSSVVVFARARRSLEGKFAGAVVVPLPTKYFSQMLSGFKLGEKGALTLRHEDFSLITRIQTEDMPNTVVPVGDTKVSSKFARLIAAGNTQATYHAVMPFDQIERIASYRKISNAPMYAVVAISKSHFLSEWRKTSWRAVGFLVLFLAVTNGSALLIFRQWKHLQRDASRLRCSNDRLEASIKAIHERDNALASAQEAGGLGTYVLDIPTGVWTCSDKMDEILGIDLDYPHTYTGWLQLVHEDDRESMSAYFGNEVVRQRGLFDREYRIVRPRDGITTWVHGLGKLDFDAQGQPIRMSGTIQHIGTRKLAEERLHLAQEVFHSATEGILITDVQGSIIETNPAFTRITGYTREEAQGQTPRILKSGEQDDEFYRQFWNVLIKDGLWEGEIINLRKDGTTYLQHSRVIALRDAQGAITRYTAMISDITAIKESQRKLERMAFYDELTGLPNRSLLTDRMHQAMAQCRRKEKKSLAVCFLDLDGLKLINDQRGNDIGDLLLIETAKRLEGCTRAGDTVARFGGDEFVVLFCDLVEENEVETAVSRLLTAVAEPHDIMDVRTQITVSVGVTLYPSDEIDEPDVLIRHADQAMFEAKRNGKNSMHFFDPENDRRLREQQQQRERLIEALAHEEFRLFYQPKVDLRTGAVIGAEALIRWQHPERGLLPPSQFIPAIEATELTLPVGEWVLHEALQQKRRWQQLAIDLPLSVNIFGQHLQRADFVERLESILLSYPDIAPEGLELEILETTALDNMEEIPERICDCSKLGVRFSLDDFGTGYSSLSYLRQLPVSHVKIDGSFVRDMLGNRSDQALVKGIIEMAHALQREVIAEGVETFEHGVELLRCGCDWAQGYGIARPMPPDAIPDWIALWRIPDIWKNELLSQE